MTHWKKLTNPNYLGAYSIEDGQDLVLTISNVKNEIVTGTDGKKEECVVCYFKENAKPMILNATNMKTITKLFGTPYIEEWQDRKIQIGIERVKAFGEIVEALRVRKTKPIEQAKTKIKCESCQSEVTASNGMTAEQLSAYTKKKYGKVLCASCAMNEAKNNANEG